MEELDKFKDVMSEFLYLLCKKHSLEEYFTEDEDLEIDRLEKLIYSMYEYKLIQIEHLGLQLNYEYGNLEEDCFYTESKKYLNRLKETKNEN